MNLPILALNMGITNYLSAWSLQRKYHSLVTEGTIGGCVIFGEHQPTLTIGKNGNAEDVLVSKNDLDAMGIALHRIDRGGQVTAHMPGQLVIYPILPVRSLNLTVRRYIEKLEQMVKKILTNYEIKGESRQNLPGIWISERKICSLGIRISRRVSMHGIAINVNNDLGLFRKIVSCGDHQTRATSLTKELGYSVSISDVWGVAVDLLRSELNCQIISTIAPKLEKY